MAAIIKTESSGNPWAIGDNTTGLSYAPPTEQGAIDTAKQLVAAGHNLDLGLGQINTSNLASLGLTLDRVFEPCSNIAAAATVLTWGYARAVKARGPGQAALLAAISAYNTGSLWAGFQNGYVQRVVTNSGKAVALAIPSLTANEVVRGRRGAVRVTRGGTLSPYAAPLDAFTVAAAPATYADRRNPYKASLDIPGFVGGN